MLAAALAALAVPAVVVAADLPPGTDNAPAFEVDGDALADDGGDGSLDWDDALTGPEPDEGVIDAVRHADGTCTQSGELVLGAPGRMGTGALVCDGSVGGFADLDVFGGDKEDEGTNPVLWSIQPVPPTVPKKSDLSEVYVYATAGDSAFDDDPGPERDDDLFLTVGMTRLDVDGDSHADFELNQKPLTEPGGEGCPAVAGTYCQVRTEGDLILAFDVGAGDAAPLTRVFSFRERLGPGEFCADVQGAVPPGCYVQVQAPAGPGGEPAQLGVLNALEVPAPAWGTVGCEPVARDPKPGCRTRDRIPARGHMEGYLDLTALLGRDFDLCPGFLQVTAKTRASESIGASLKDTARPVAIRTSQCGSILVASTDAGGDPVGGAAFELDPDPLSGEEGSRRVVADGGEDDHASAAGLVCLDGVRLGSYGVVEQAVPPGYFGDDDRETVATVAASTCAQRLAAPAPSADATFSHAQGAFLIRKEDERGRLVGGATFQIVSDPATGEPGSSLEVRDADRDGIVCIEDVFVRNDAATDYEVAETVAPKGYVADDAIHVATVAAPGTCAAEVPSSPDVTVVNRKGR